jgi:hypothetical protein
LADIASKVHITKRRRRLRRRQAPDRRTRAATGIPDDGRQRFLRWLMQARFYCDLPIDQNRARSVARASLPLYWRGCGERGKAIDGADAERLAKPAK